MDRKNLIHSLFSILSYLSPKGAFLAHPRGFEPPTCRLGGGRSILLSYGCVCQSIVPKKSGSVNEKTTHFLYPGAYNGKMLAGRERRTWKKSGNMRMWTITSSQTRNGSQVRSRVESEDLRVEIRKLHTSLFKFHTKKCIFPLYRMDFFGYNISKCFV